MNIRICKRQYKGKTYQYAQLVENYRRESDGMPTCRVIAHLGPLQEQTVANLRLALKASRDGQAVVLPTKAGTGRARRGPEANLRYLELAVLRELWRECGGESLVADLIAGGDVASTDVQVLTGLILHRCVDPGSKLHAQRWYPMTALPELTGLDTRTFNNTRVHRVLDALHAATPALMKRLPDLYGELDSVSAHVTLCMLALLLERVLQSKLRAADQSITAKSCFELLQTCHLNRHRGAEGQSLYYTLTVPTDEQRRILSALGLDRLVSEEAVQRATTPRLIAT